MKKIEDAYQGLVVNILSQRRWNFDAIEVEIISDFYALWQARSERRHLPTQYVKPAGVSGTCHHHTPDELECLEKNGYIAMRSDGSVAMRDLMGPVIFLAQGRIKEALTAGFWGLVEPLGGEFCVPDVPAHGILPLTPSLALVANASSGKITKLNLANINRSMLEHSEEYVFARDLRMCPGLGRATDRIG